MKLKNLLMTLTVTTTLGTIGMISTQAHAASSHPVYRLYNPNTGEHFYTENFYEQKVLSTNGWRYEGIGWQTADSGTPVYRVYNPNAKGGDHYYTMSRYEAQSLVNKGWRWDNNGKAAFYSAGNTNLYVAYNPNAQSGAHNYTTNSYEQNSLLAQGWKYGKVAWKTMGNGSPAPTAPVTPKKVDVNVTGVGGIEQNIPGSYRLLYSNKPFDLANLPGVPTIEFSADVSLTGSSSDYENQFVIAGNAGNGSGQVGVELHYQAGNDSNFGQGRINVTTINFPAGAGTSGQQFYSVKTDAPRVANGQSVKLQVKYYDLGYMQAFVNGVLVGQYKTKLLPGGNTYILHDYTNATSNIRNIKVMKNGKVVNPVTQGSNPLISQTFTNKTLVAAY
ncbi:hypothetical protein [Lactococcus lactis]